MAQDVQKAATESKKSSRTADDESFQAFVESLITPGAGLTRCDNDNPSTLHRDTPVDPPIKPDAEYIPMARRYSSDEEM